MDRGPVPRVRVVARFGHTGPREGPPDARGESDLARWLATGLIADLLATSRHSVRLGSTPLGETLAGLPPGGPDLRLSLSHADGVALCAVAQGCAVGADVESMRRVGPDLGALAELACTPRELRRLRAAPGPARARMFLALWTAKEAVGKALGLGHHASLSRIEVLPAVRGGLARVAPGGLGEAPTAWRVAWHPVSPHHLAAIAVPGGTTGSRDPRLGEAAGGSCAPT